MRDSTRMLRSDGAPDPVFSSCSRRTPPMVRAARRSTLRTTSAVITTSRSSPSFDTVLRSGLIKIGQDHLNFSSQVQGTGHPGPDQGRVDHGMDVFVTLTKGDEADYRRLFGWDGARVTTIPNALSWPGRRVPDGPA
jgi:hypothetical protein